MLQKKRNKRLIAAPPPLFFPPSSKPAPWDRLQECNKKRHFDLCYLKKGLLYAPPLFLQDKASPIQLSSHFVHALTAVGARKWWRRSAGAAEHRVAGGPEGIDGGKIVR